MNAMDFIRYHVHPDTGIIDYDQVAELANAFKPKLLICGASAYVLFIISLQYCPKGERERERAKRKRERLSFYLC